MEKELREYQQNIVKDVLDSKKDTLIVLPTGGGKTVIASSLIDSLPGKVLFVVPRLELIKQANEEFGDVDIIWSNNTVLEGKHCILASKDSLRSQFKNLAQNLKDEIHEGTMIIDEAHVSLEQSYKLVQQISPKRVIGLTATPERMDGYALLKGEDSIHKYGIFDEMCQEETVPSLIRKGYLCPLRYYAKPIAGISEIKPENSLSEELSGNQMTQIFNDNNIWGDLVKSYEEYGKGRPALGFTTTVEMGKTVVEIFNNAGYDFRIIHGEMSVKERQSLIDMLKNREIDGLVNAALLTYGFDCPPVSYAFNCRHIKSRPLWFQIVGRILRTCKGKKDAIFVDHADSISEFSDPDCSLPIMDEAIEWRVHGESKIQRQKRKYERKRVQETMALIQAFDPLPIELVEITVENTWDRLIRIINNLRSENDELIIKNGNLQEYLSDARDRFYEKEERYRDKINELEEENEQIKNSTPVQKEIDRDETFNYIKSNYGKIRTRIERERPGIDRIGAHNLTVETLKMQEYKLPFYYDDNTFKNSTDWWKEHYKSYVIPQKEALLYLYTEEIKGTMDADEHRYVVSYITTPEMKKCPICNNPIQIRSYKSPNIWFLNALCPECHHVFMKSKHEPTKNTHETISKCIDDWNGMTFTQQNIDSIKEKIKNKEIKEDDLTES
ncbi:MAG: DEAD/DEAH box helicase [Lachnospiraceae bacterium]|nr:DEAD/DEAH box helicase [Lachnospiraceae bacterium]